ncbi:MAG: RIO1 family regulatory kinase/ATPase [Bacteroidota bacterium]
MAKFKVTTHTGKSLYLKDENEIHRGGEGRILLIDSQKGKVAKVYHKGIKSITEERFNVLMKLDKSLFLTPQELLLQNGVVIGYTMVFAGSAYFPLSSCFSKNFCLRLKMNSKTKKKIAHKLIEAVKTAHKHNIIIGDLNQYNVLVNEQGEIKLIDTDSYKTPGYVHSGLLLDEIRDYLYQGIVSKNSDYFALSVLLFYLYTYTHPFKGIHQKIKKLADRMIYKIPVFANDPLLKVPKCYQALQDKTLQNDFNRLYVNGERFILSISGTGKIEAAKPKVTALKRFDEKELIITPILQNENIINVRFGSAAGYIETDNQFIVYSAGNKAYVNRRFIISKKEYDEIFVTDRNVLLKKNDTLYHYKNNSDIIQLFNFHFQKDSILHQSENILMVIGSNQMYKVYLDEIHNSSIANKRIEVFGPAFHHHNGLIQNSGGVQRIFYNTGKDIATIKAGKYTKMLYQKGSVGVIQSIENKKLSNYYFKIKGLKQEFSSMPVELFTHFAFMSTEAHEGFIFEPADNKIRVLRIQDFRVISEIQSNLISSQTGLHYTKSGIIAWEDNSVYLINKKDTTS